jgi:TP901 family phage tail tape measure protein
VAEVAKGIIDIEINTGSAASTLQALQSQINAFNLALNKANATQGKFSAEYTKKLQDAINKTGLFTAETIRLETAAATLDKTLSKGKTSLGQYFSARFNKDGAIAAETMALASERARRLQTQFIATSSAANGFQDALAVRPLAAFSSQVAVAGQKAEIMSAMFKQGTTQLINFGKNVQWAGRQLMVGFTVPLTIFGAVAGKTFMELEKQVVGFKKVYGDLFTTPAELNQNLEAVKGLASEYTKYGIAVKDTIGLAAQAAAAGRKGADLADAVSQATRLATLGQMDQNAALETTISLQSAFRLSGQDLADTINFLNMVENQTVVSLQDIAAAIPRVAPVIQGLGGDVKDLTVFLAAMQEGGVDAAEGANALKSGLASLINPTRQATDMLTGMGINLQSIIDINKGDLMGTVMSFSQALSSLDQFSRQQALEQVFGKFQYAKLGALFENITRQGSQAQQVIATMGYTTEQLGSTAEKELKTIEESFGVQLTGAMERFKLAIAPIGEIFVKLAIPLVNFATSVAEAFNGLSDGQKKFAAIGAVVIGVVVPAVTMLTGLFLNLVGTLAKMTQGITLFGMGFIKGGPLGAVKALTQSSKYLSLAEMDAAMAAQQLAGANQALNATLVEQVGSSNAAAAAIGNLTKAYAAMISTQGAAAARFPEQFGVAGAAGTRAKVSQVAMRGVQRRNSGGPIFMSNGTTVPGTGNTDTVPAMLTPGEFVVNKKATKNNLGLLHSINDSKSPQGLNAGGKAKGMQYFGKENAQREVLPSDADIASLSAFDDDTPTQRRRTDSQVSRNAPVTRNSSEVPRNLLERFPGSDPIKPIDFDKKTFLHMQRNVVNAGGNAKLSGARYMDMALSVSNLTPTEQAYAYTDKMLGYKGSRMVGNIGFNASSYLNAGNHSIQDLIDDLNYRILYGENPYAGTMKAAGLSPQQSRSAKTKVHSQVVGKLRAMQHAGQTTFNTRDLQMSGVYKVMEKAVEKSLRISGVGAQGIQDLYFGGTKNVKDFGLRPGVSLGKRAFQSLPQDIKDLFIMPDTPEGRKLGLQSNYLVPKGFEHILKDGKGIRIGGSSKHKKINSQLLKEAAAAVVTRGRSLRMNSGGQVPGMQYFAANNKQRVVQEAYKAASGIRRRVRPGKEERLAQQSALHNFAFDSRNVRETPAMDTILGMMKPLTQKTRATRGTVLGSTRNKELPYAQQKRIVAAIKEGRYEDLFGMKLNFKGGAGSYTTKRDLDFAPFIGDLSNPTLKDFSYGFMGLDTQKKDIDKLRKIMRSGKFKKLTPGTAEYARELGMAGWSPARSFRPGANPTIGSDWTIEQVIENKLRDYNNRKKQLNTAFPDKKIQQLFIDEMVGSGVLALDMQKASYKHPVMSDRNNRVKRLRAKEHELLVGDRTSQVTGVATDLKTKLPSLITQSGAQGFNRGNIVPGTGNTDTVPAMLTPGEFVVNKEATKNNYDLLTAINNSQRLNKGGMAYRGSNEAPPRLLMNSGGAVQYLGVGGMIAGMAPMAAGLGASMLPTAMAPEMGMFGQIAASTVAFTAAQKSVKAVLMKFEKVSLKAVDSTGQVGEGFKKLFPQLSKLSPNILKFIGPLSGAGAAIALVGFGAYKLNKQINDASKAGGKLAAAMYGTADSTNAIAETFGRQTRAQQAMVAAAEKATGEQVSEESQQVSSQFMQSDAGKALLKDIAFVQSSGKDAAIALRNQLSQAIIAGAITAEEARAIAIDIGTALENERLAVEVSGKISQLMGPNGEKLTAENILKIQAEITPSVDISQVRDDAKSAYDDLNQMQKMFSVFKGGSSGFENQYKLEEVLTVNNSALSAQLNTVEFLNAAFKEGTITLENYKKALDDSKNVTGNTLDANAQILGFENNQSLIANADVEAQQKQDSPFSWLWQESSALKAMEEQKAQVRTLLEESGAYSDEAINKIIKDFEGVGNTSWGKLLTGEWSPTDAQMVINFQTQGLTTEEIDELVFKLGVIESLPDITTVIDFKNPNPKAIEELYSTYEQLQSAAAKGPLTQEVLVQATGMDIFNGEIMSAINALPSSVSIPIIMSVAWDAETNKKLNAKEGTSAEQSATLQDALLKKLKTSFGNLTPKPGTIGGDKSGGNSEKSKLDDLKKMLMERFRLQEMLIDKEAEGFNKRIKNISREIQLQQRQVALEEKQIEVRQKALEELSKKEDEVNTVYDNRISALDRVSASNSRLANQEQSRITLASALASGDIAGAASAMSSITQQSAESQIEDTKTALETQRETALKNLTVDVNGTLMTRKGIEEGIEAIQIRIDAIQTSIYDKNILIQGLEDELLKTEDKRLKVAEAREKVETRLYLMEQKKAIEGLTAQSKKKKGLTTEEKQELAEYKLSYNNMAALYNQQNPSTPIQLLNSGGQVSGTGMTDTVPAMLTPGEFVIRKGAAKTFLPLLESINSGVFPSIGGMDLGSPRYDVPVSNVTNVPVSQSITNSSNASTMYNNSYSINVNVSGSNSSADEIANVVMGKIARSNSGSIRGSRY